MVFFSSCETSEIFWSEISSICGLVLSSDWWSLLTLVNPHLRDTLYQNLFLLILHYVSLAFKLHSDQQHSVLSLLLYCQMMHHVLCRQQHKVHFDLRQQQLLFFSISMFIDAIMSLTLPLKVVGSLFFCSIT